MSSRISVPLPRLLAWGQPLGREQGGEGLGAAVARQRYHRALFLMIGFWALATCVTAAVVPLVALAVAAAGLTHIIAGYRVEQRRRADERRRV